MAFYGEQDFPRDFTLLIIQDFIALTTTFLNCNELGTLGIYFYAFHQNLLLRENEQKCYEALPKIESFDKLRLLGLQSHPHIVILGIYLNLIQSFEKETSKGWIQLTLFTIYSLNNISLTLAVNSKSCSKKKILSFCVAFTKLKKDDCKFFFLTRLQFGQFYISVIKRWRKEQNII